MPISSSFPYRIELFFLYEGIQLPCKKEISHPILIKEIMEKGMSVILAN